VTETGGNASAQQADSFSEDEDPTAPAPPGLDYTEYEDPAETGKQTLATRKWEHEARQQTSLHATRTWLAIGFFWLVAVMTMLPIGALVFSHWSHFTVDEFKELGLFFTPIVTLAGAAFGFFFATDDRKSRQ
jgi:hypothetical protein